MGRNQKQANRTKNNTKPSSSSRSAEKLGANLPGFVGFSATPDGGYATVLPGFSSAESFDSKVDPNTQTVLRKMCKKDSVTKLKALNEFISLIKFSEEALILEVLSFWPRLYNQLGSDCNNRVREAAQIAHAALVEKVGRNIAPYLKQTVPAWIASQYDIYGPAKTKAREGFENAFPRGKICEVMNFCRAEILSYAVENLTIHTPLTLMNPKLFNAEECESIYERSLITTLQGYEFFINNLPECSVEWLCENQIKLLDNSKFWELGKSKIPQIRSSFYSLIGSSAKRVPKQFAPKYGEKSCTLIFGRLCENDLDSIVSILENSILLMAYIPEWWKYADIEKMLSCISTVLSNGGGWTNTTRIGPLMAPLLMHLLNVPDVNRALLYDDFISSVCRGLEIRGVIFSKTSYEAWIKGLVECFEYVANTKLENDDDTKKINILTLSKTIRTWFTTIMRPKICNSTFDYVKLNNFYLSKISFSWTKHSLQGDNTNTFSQLVRIFWQNLHFLIVSQLNSANADEAEIKTITALHSELLIGLKSKNNVKTKKVCRVKFDIDQSNIEPDKNNTEDSTNVKNNVYCPITKNYQHSLNKTVNDVCAQYMTYAVEKNISSPILNSLFSLIREFNSQQLYSTMLSSVANKDNLPLIVLYENYFASWLKGDSMRSQVVVDLTFLMFDYLNKEDQTQILDSFDQFPLPVIKWCISRCICHPYLSNSIIRQWLLSNTVHQSLLALCKLIIKEGDKRHMDLVKMCFVQFENEGLIISKKTSSEIVLTFINSLTDYTSNHLNMCALFASYLSSINHIILDENHELQYKLLISLFTLDCNSQKIKDGIPEDTLHEINSTWQDSLSTLSMDNLINFVGCASQVIHKKLIESEEVLGHLQSIEKLVDLSYNLICSCIKANNDNCKELYKIISSLLKNRFDDVNKYIDRIEIFSLSADILNGHFTCALTNDSPQIKNSIEKCLSENSTNLNENELIQSLSWVLYSVKLMEKIVLELYISRKSSLETDTCDDYNNVVNHLFDERVFYVEVKNSWIEILYNITILKTLYAEYKMMTWYDTLLKFYTPIKSAMINTFKNVSTEQYEDIKIDLQLNSWTYGLYWSTCLNMYDAIMNPIDIDINTLLACEIDDMVMKYEKDQNINDVFGIKFCHKIQVIKNSSSELNGKSNMTVAGILALRQIYFNKYIKETYERPFLTSEELKNITLSPASILSLIDGHFPLKDLISPDCDLMLKSWEEVHCTVAIVKFLTICIDEIGWDLQFKEWDFITITLVSLLQSVTEAKNNFDNLKVSILGCAILNFYHSMNKFISSILPESIRREPTETILQLLDEWRDLVSPAVHSYIIEIFMKLCTDGLEPNSEMSPIRIFLINDLNKAIEVFEWKYVESNDNQYSVNNVLQICLNLMALPCHHILKYLANIVLKLLTPIMINADKLASNQTNEPNDEIPSSSTTVPTPLEKPIYCVHIIEPILLQLQSCMDAVLSPYKIGDDQCILVPYSDSHSIALGYLLVWEVLLDIAQESTAYLQHEYSEFFKEGQFVDQLLNVLFRLLPEELADLSKTSSASNIFKNTPKLGCDVPITWELINTLACHRLLRCLQGGWLAALVRSWWGSLPVRISQYIEQIIRIHVSPLLIANQLAMVSKKQGNIPNIEISIHPSVNEVACIYVIEDLKMGLTIQLCNNHPLNKPQVVSSGTPLNNMAWLSMYLSHQNGSVYQAIRMWANAVQKKVESTPVCYVCYCRLHPNTGQLPKMLCQTCKNKFHNVCLYKWFSTSGKATCPMCRNVFNV